MKFKDIVYPAILGILTNVRGLVDDFEERNTSDEISEFGFYVDSCIADIQKIIEENRDEKILASIPNDIFNNADIRQFIDSNSAIFRKLKILLTLGALLENDELLDSEFDFPIDQFKIITDTGGELPFNVFGIVNNSRKIDSIGYISCSSDDWIWDISNSNFNSLLLIGFIDALDKATDLEYNKRYILVRKDAQINKSIESAFRLQAVVHGLAIHVPRKSNIPPSLCAVNHISPLDPYQQFDETITILSEFNSREELLNKFLSLYHIVESFMYKLPIINLGENNNGNKFSIRDFRRLYKKVEKSEEEAIKEIFKKYWDFKIDGEMFNKIVLVKLQSLRFISNFNTVDLDIFLQKLGLFTDNGYVQLTNSTASANYAKLIYKVRCAIVHNSETEMHISHFTLSETIAHLIDEVLMKPLEMLILNIVAEKSSGIWYTGPSFHLYHAS